MGSTTAEVFVVGAVRVRSTNSLEDAVVDFGQLDLSSRDGSESSSAWSHDC